MNSALSQGLDSTPYLNVTRSRLNLLVAWATEDDQKLTQLRPAFRGGGGTIDSSPEESELGEMLTTLR
jgi:hypothetical protein